MPAATLITVPQFSRLIGLPDSPAVIDVRIDDDYRVDPRLPPGSLRRDHRAIGSWAPEYDGQSVIVVCQRGEKLSEGTALHACLEVTALHNHFFFDEPKVYFMHIGGTGEAATVAAGVKKVYDKVAEIRAANPTPTKVSSGTIASPGSITPAPLETALGVKGQASQGMFKIVIGRPASMLGVPVGKEMGFNTWAAFAGSDGDAVIDGDFAMLENELQQVLPAMRKEGINMVAIHQHMTHEQPRCLFLHYWGKGKAVDLAQSLRRVLDAQAAVKS